ncbi:MULTISPECIES: aldo/keto reductase [unclassified Yoonia]|uniref:aldo/keto reductase n=1 Tax=unclassified Yoonia TaxID=2629118 RepID=UPI002AFF220F|nr:MULTISPECIES: aldo/keto reductase [unclassified Yoonia]
MQKIKLGRSDIMVTDWCLGTMTYGNQTDRADAYAQMDMALEAGINFLDTAEMYPVNPIRAETVGLSETIVGEWLATSGRRSEVVIATKVSGNNPGWVREGRGYDGAIIRQTVEASLRRLQTDVIDLYQMHWPERGSYAFRQNWTYDPSGQDRQRTMDHMLDVLEALDDCVKAGKIRAIGMSNESAWGMTKWVDQATAAGLPRMVSVQNEYSLLCRLYDTDMAEMAVNEDVTLLSYSPLACGLLTGKYQHDVPAGSRLSINGNLGGRMTPRTLPVTQVYLDLARDHGVDPVHMAMAWQATRPFPVSAIFGATTKEQLSHILAGRDTVLTDDLLAAIEAAHKANPQPY